jgi:hypothetical protein
VAGGLVAYAGADKPKEAYDDLSAHRCSCGRQIKARLARIKRRPPKLCYRCWQQQKFTERRRKEDAARRRAQG